MERFLIIGDKCLDINMFSEFNYGDGIKAYMVSDMEIQIRMDDEIIKVEPVNNMINEYGEEEIKKIPYENPKIIMLSYSSGDFMKKVLDAGRFPEGTLADDFTKIMALGDFIEKFNRV